MHAAFSCVSGQAQQRPLLLCPLTGGVLSLSLDTPWEGEASSLFVHNIPSQCSALMAQQKSPVGGGGILAQPRNVSLVPDETVVVLTQAAMAVNLGLFRILNNVD